MLVPATGINFDITNQSTDPDMDRFKYFRFLMDIACNSQKTCFHWMPNADTRTAGCCKIIQLILQETSVEIGNNNQQRSCHVLYPEVREEVRKSCIIAHNAVIRPLHSHDNLTSVKDKMYHILHVNEMMKYGYYLQMGIPITTNEFDYASSQFQRFTKLCDLSTIRGREYKRMLQVKLLNINSSTMVKRYFLQ